MQAIEAIKDWDCHLLFVMRGCTWPEAIKQLREEWQTGIGSRNLLELAVALSSLPNAGTLHASKCMMHLVVSDTPDFQGVNGVLHISHDRSAGRFVIRHIAMDGRQECMACCEKEAVQTYARLVGEKFLITARA